MAKRVSGQSLDQRVQVDLLTWNLIKALLQIAVFGEDFDGGESKAYIREDRHVSRWRKEGKHRERNRNAASTTISTSSRRTTFAAGHCKCSDRERNGWGWTNCSYSWCRLPISSTSYVRLFPFTLKISDHFSIPKSMWVSFGAPNIHCPFSAMFSVRNSGPPFVLVCSFNIPVTSCS